MYSIKNTPSQPTAAYIHKATIKRRTSSRGDGVISPIKHTYTYKSFAVKDVLEIALNSTIETVLHTSVMLLSYNRRSITSNGCNGLYDDSVQTEVQHAPTKTVSRTGED